MFYSNLKSLFAPEIPQRPLQSDKPRYLRGNDAPHKEANNSLTRNALQQKSESDWFVPKRFAVTPPQVRTKHEDLPYLARAPSTTSTAINRSKTPTVLQRPNWARPTLHTQDSKNASGEPYYPRSTLKGWKLNADASYEYEKKKSTAEQPFKRNLKSPIRGSGSSYREVRRDGGMSEISMEIKNSQKERFSNYAENSEDMKSFGNKVRRCRPPGKASARESLVTYPQRQQRRLRSTSIDRMSSISRGGGKDQFIDVAENLNTEQPSAANPICMYNKYNSIESSADKRWGDINRVRGTVLNDRNQNKNTVLDNTMTMARVSPLKKQTMDMRGTHSMRIGSTSNKHITSNGAVGSALDVTIYNRCELNPPSSHYPSMSSAANHVTSSTKGKAYTLQDRTGDSTSLSYIPKNNYDVGNHSKNTMSYRMGLNGINSEQSKSAIIKKDESSSYSVGRRNELGDRKNGYMNHPFTRKEMDSKNRNKCDKKENNRKANTSVNSFLKELKGLNGKYNNGFLTNAKLMNEEDITLDELLNDSDIKDVNEVSTNVKNTKEVKPCNFGDKLLSKYEMNCKSRYEDPRENRSVISNKYIGPPSDELNPIYPARNTYLYPKNTQGVMNTIHDTGPLGGRQSPSSAVMDTRVKEEKNVNTHQETFEFSENIKNAMGSSQWPYKSSNTSSLRRPYTKMETFGFQSKKDDKSTVSMKPYGDTLSQETSTVTNQGWFSRWNMNTNKKGEEDAKDIENPLSYSTLKSNLNESTFQNIISSKSNNEGIFDCDGIIDGTMNTAHCGDTTASLNDTLRENKELNNCKTTFIPLSELDDSTRDVIDLSLTDGDVMTQKEDNSNGVGYRDSLDERPIQMYSSSYYGSIRNKNRKQEGKDDEIEWRREYNIREYLKEGNGRLGEMSNGDVQSQGRTRGYDRQQYASNTSSGASNGIHYHKQTFESVVKCSNTDIGVVELPYDIKRPQVLDRIDEMNGMKAENGMRDAPNCNMVFDSIRGQPLNGGDVEMRMDGVENHRKSVNEFMSAVDEEEDRPDVKMLDEMDVCNSEKLSWGDMNGITSLQTTDDVRRWRNIQKVQAQTLSGCGSFKEWLTSGGEMKLRKSNYKHSPFAQN